MAEEVKVAGIGGKFAEALSRNSKAIKESRAASIIEDAELVYSRTLDDLKRTLKRKVREQDDILDMSPDNITTIINVKDFNADEFVKADVKLAREIQDIKEKIELLQARYDYLFGGE